MKIEDILDKKKGNTLFLLGNEAAVRGALEGGVSFCSTYPGTPSSEIGNVLAKIAKKAGIYFEFSVNEKVALEVSAAAAASGLRSFVFMKHVGLNVAADALMSTAYTGVRGGLIILSADDPSMHSSQNEQDNRIMAQLAGIPVLEPSNPQEVKDFMKLGFDLSEKFEIPVLMRTTTRISHMRAVVQMDQVPDKQKQGFFIKDKNRFNVAPACARKLRKSLLEKHEKLIKWADKAAINRIINADRKGQCGIIASGASYNYVMDVINQHQLKIKVLKLGLPYPFPERLVQQFMETVEQILVIEEVEPVIEKEVFALLGKKNMHKRIFGKLDGTLPRIYEYHPDIITEALERVLNLKIKKGKALTIDLPLPLRPPVLCPGCPHRATIFAIKQAVKALNIEDKNIIYSNDIGCYTLAMQPPYNMADYCICMGSSIGIGSGMAKATKQKIVALIGDSTFFHAGIPPLINAVHNRANIMVVVLDNRITAMTGGQPNPSIPIDGLGDKTPEVSIEKMAKATGAGYVEVINPGQLKKSIDIFKKALQYESVSVIISRAPCIMLKRKKKHPVFQINQEKCTRCRVCLESFTCPAFYQAEDGSVHINDLLCTGCGVCIQVCPQKAIEVKK